MNEGERLRRIADWASGALTEMNHMAVPDAERLATCVLADIEELGRYRDLSTHLHRTWEEHARIMGWRAP